MGESSQSNSGKGKEKDTDETLSANSRNKRTRYSGCGQSDTNKSRNENPSSETSISEGESDISVKLACPFRKYNPAMYVGCAMLKWEATHRVKEHLYRRHRAPIYCKRCWTTFKDQTQLDQHITVDLARIFPLKSGVSPDGLTPETESKLRSRKRIKPNATEGERWIHIYKVLFPHVADNDIPCPYFEEPLFELPLSPKSRGLADFEERMRRELPQMVSKRIEDVVRREMEPIEDDFRRQMQPTTASILGKLVSTIRDCQEALSRSILKSDGAIPGSPVTADDSTNVPQQDDEVLSVAGFSNAMLQQIPTFAENIYDHVDAVVGQPGQTDLSASEYGSVLPYVLP